MAYDLPKPVVRETNLRNSKRGKRLCALMAGGASAAAVDAEVRKLWPELFREAITVVGSRGAVQVPTNAIDAIGPAIEMRPSQAAALCGSLSPAGREKVDVISDRIAAFSAIEPTLSADEERLLRKQDASKLRDRDTVAGKPPKPLVLSPAMKPVASFLHQNGTGPYVQETDLPAICDAVWRYSRELHSDPRGAWPALRTIRNLIGHGLLRGIAPEDAQKVTESHIRFLDHNTLRAARIARGLTQTRVAELLLDLDPLAPVQSISKWEEGSYLVFGERVELLAAVLDVPVEALYRGGPNLPLELDRFPSDYGVQRPVRPALPAPPPEPTPAAPPAPGAASEPQGASEPEPDYRFLEGGLAHRLFQAALDARAMEEQLVELKDHSAAQGLEAELARLRQKVDRQATLIESQREHIARLEDQLLGDA